MAKVLLHCCCAPCATHTLERLREEGHEVSAYWYNPNIHPFTEHRSRLESMQQYAGSVGLPLTVADGYDIIDYFRAVVGHEGQRCRDCFCMRLQSTAQAARDGGFEAFTTTLLISPYQKHDVLRQEGERAAAEHGVRFHYEDFRDGFRRSQQMSRELGLYHQKYCGCVYSEWERFGRVNVERLLGGP